MSNYIEDFNIGGNPYDIRDKVARAMAPDEFDQTKTYAKDDYCIYQNALYKFTAGKEAGAWDSTKVSMTRLTTELKNLKEKDDELTNNLNGYDAQTIESFSGNVISSGSIKIEKKNGWCHISGRLVLSGAIADSTNILSGIPKPKNGVLNMTVTSTSNTFARALYIGISSDGIMSARWGSANTHYIDISYCYSD